ncbi:hypothetical protein UA08_00299 [Talaromyces atroroseus]|uniref:Mmc1 C-terminal domain-containing protein n=1 Tax=Talaromyces atroroseus TaxID=1441469 RepID=A0A225AU68_TALAT|nr:hypothetical protein UA08_00299 [Talaromyces atroroseus]OKL64480.1 hypothetical protein UA08_00299 [Talaromyces atroroseus]
MPTKLRAAVRRSLVPLADKSGAAGIIAYPSCSTCRRRTLSTAATASTSTSTTNYRTRNGNFRANYNIAPSARYSNDGLFGGVGDTNNDNKKNIVPPHLRDLHKALTELQEVAADHVSLSRLQLAQRGLESEDPVIRVAILGINDVRATRRLVRLLLADPLTEKQAWEDLIESYGIEESNGLLIRYGQDSGIVESSLCPTISISSPVLKRGGIEIFVSTLGAGAEPATVPVTDEAFFVPTITVSTSESGGGQHHELIRYPVHRSIICGTGTDGLLAYSSLLGRAVNLNSSEQLIHGVIELTVNGAKSTSNNTNTVTFVDANKAEEALAKFRESVHFASEYERGWTASGAQSIADWLSNNITPAEKKGLGSDLQILVRSLLDTAEAEVITEETARLKEQELTSASAETRQSLDQSVSTWAERAHTELRNALDEGFASRRWKALSWWKLFWRVDDVGSVMAEILQTRYLPRAEKEMIWTAGRVKQTGLLDSVPDAEDLSQTKPEEGEPHPWPLQIATSRLQMLSTTIPSLQALSQGLVLFSASTTGLTSALSGLLYASASTGLYEACTIAAVGLIYSMRRQQVKWENARSSWEAEVRENGRTALVETEELLRTLIRDGPVRRQEESAETRARMVIARARNALEGVGK